MLFPKQKKKPRNKKCAKWYRKKRWCLDFVVRWRKLPTVMKGDNRAQMKYYLWLLWFVTVVMVVDASAG